MCVGRWNYPGKKKDTENKDTRSKPESVSLKEGEGGVFEMKP